MHAKYDAAFDTLYGGQATVSGDIRGFGCPGRNRPNTWNDQEHLAFAGYCKRPSIGQQFRQYAIFMLVEFTGCLDEMDVRAINVPDMRDCHFQ